MGFLKTGDRYIEIDHPDGDGHTVVQGINNLGQIVGMFMDAVTKDFRGFLLEGFAEIP